LIADSDAIRSIDPAILQAVTHAYGSRSRGRQRTATVCQDRTPGGCRYIVMPRPYELAIPVVRQFR
jgi:hypothetical protein